MLRPAAAASPMRATAFSTLRAFDVCAGHLHQRHDDRAGCDRRTSRLDSVRFELVIAAHGNLCPMTRKPVRGLFITGTDTEVGKTYVAALIARALVAAGHRVGVYKPAASGCSRRGRALVSDDALALWQAAGSPGTLAEVCPQVFAAPLAPHLAAAAEGKRLDAALLRRGLDVWLERSRRSCLIEGAGGLMSPLGEDEYVADLAYDFGFPLVVVARNGLGVINHVLQTLITAATFRDGLAVAGIVLNETRAERRRPEHRARTPARFAAGPCRRCWPKWPIRPTDLTPSVDWFALAAEAVTATRRRRGRRSVSHDPRHAIGFERERTRTLSARVRSRRDIARKAAQMIMRGGRSRSRRAERVVLGAGACDEIPLAELAGAIPPGDAQRRRTRGRSSEGIVAAKLAVEASRKARRARRRSDRRHRTAA